MNKDSSEKIIEIIEYYKNNINSHNKNISEFSKLKYNNYINYAKKYSISKENIITKFEETNISNEEYINNICKNNDIKNKLENYNNILKNNLLNLNEEFINTWVNSYKDFSEKNSLDKNQMIIYANNQIKILNKKEYIIDNNFKLNKDKTVKEDLKENEVLPQNIIENTFNKNTSASVEQQIIPSIEKDKSKDITSISSKNNTEELKIISRKKAKHNKKDIAILTGISLASIALFGLTISGTIAILYAISKLKNSFNYRTKINNLLKKYKITKNEDGTLIDEDGKIIDSNYKEKNIYNMIKQELIKLENEVSEGKIKKLYKKNKLTSKLLNNKIVVNLKSKLKYKPEEKDELLETQDIKKGFGAVK